MKRRTAVTALLVVSLLSLAACGDDGAPVDAGGSPTDDTTTTGDTTTDDDTTDDTTADTTDDTTDDPAGAPADDGTGDGTPPPLGGGPYPIATLEVTVTHPEADPALTYTISCLGDTATITPAVDGLDERSACERLADPETKALLVDGPPDDRICTEIYGGPDEAEIRGTIDDQPVDTVITRNNGCGIDDWDNVLAGVLPAAIGPS